MKNTKTFLAAAAVGLLIANGAQAIMYDVNDNDQAASVTQPGWTAVNQNNINGVTFTAVGTGVAIDDRDRTGNGGGAEASMWRDFIFATNSNLASEGLDISISGLTPDSFFDVRLWAFDEDSNGGRQMTWNGNILGFPNSPDPATLDDYVVSFQAMSNASGVLVLQGRGGPQAGSAPNVFVNGFEIIQIPEPATASLALLGLGGLMIRRRRMA